MDGGTADRVVPPRRSVVLLQYHRVHGARLETDLPPARSPNRWP
jgi:hypothetical protein